MILACGKSAYYWATAFGAIGVAWAFAFSWWAFLHYGGTIE